MVARFMILSPIYLILMPILMLAADSPATNKDGFLQVYFPEQWLAMVPEKKRDSLIGVSGAGSQTSISKFTGANLWVPICRVRD